MPIGTSISNCSQVKCDVCQWNVFKSTPAHNINASFDRNNFAGRFYFFHAWFYVHSISSKIFAQKEKCIFKKREREIEQNYSKLYSEMKKKIYIYTWIMLLFSINAIFPIRTQHDLINVYTHTHILTTEHEVKRIKDIRIRPFKKDITTLG